MRYRLNPNVTFQALEDKMVAWDSESGHTVVLNHTGWFILYLIEEGTDTLQAIVEAVAKEYAVKVEDIKEDVEKFLKSMEEVKLIWKEES
ncbi:MAG: HPr-rel-A system PqqD family peptide chaperone [Thermotogae bacterium]|nr:HPr-rel-A system PqqD family peptide chaperone [Thermotogota bacterium]